MISIRPAVYLLYVLCISTALMSGARHRPDERDFSVTQRFEFALQERPFAAVLFFDRRSQSIEDRFNRINVDRYAGNVAFVRVNVSNGAEQWGLAQRYAQSIVPSILLFVKGELLRDGQGSPVVLVGYPSLYDIEAFVARHLADRVDGLREHQADPDVAYASYQESQDRRNWQKYPPYYYRDPYFNWTYPYYRGYYGGYTTLGLGVSL